MTIDGLGRCLRALGIAMLAAVLLADPTTAAAATRQADGCADLAAAVDAAASAAISRRLVAPGSSAHAPTKPAGDDAARNCATVAATTSQAYTKALRRFGIDVDWNGGNLGDPGDRCLSHYLDQCYPSPARGPLTPASGIDSLVTGAWAAVRAGVRRQMPFGVAGDFAWFRPVRLEDTLAAAISATLDAARPVALPATSLQQYRE